MKVLVIGLGSMGKRRIRLIQRYATENNIEIRITGLDTKEDRCSDVQNCYHIDTMSNFDNAIQKELDCVFVCTSPLSHAKIINKCLEQKLHVFTEINLVDDMYQENMSLAKLNNRVLFLSSTFLYREEINYIKRNVKPFNGKMNYIYHIGQYLPDWHPWEDYKNYFIGNKKTNGCREIMSIELPWLIDTFGNVSDIKVNKDNQTNLNIDYYDNYMIMLTHDNGNKGILVIDVVSRKAVRNFETYGENIYISWNGQPTGLYQYDYKEKKNENINLYGSIDSLEGYAAFVVENAYMNEIKAFFEQVTFDKKSIYGFEKDHNVLKLIDKIEGE